MLISLRRDPLEFLVRVASDFGDAAYFRAGPLHLYLFSHPDQVREVLVTNTRSFKKGQGLQEARRIIGEGLLTSEGDHHRRQRRLIQPMFHHARIAGYADVMV
jgi:cytochrome P450